MGKDTEYNYHKGRFYGDPDGPKPLSAEQMKKNEGDLRVWKGKGKVGPVPKQTAYKQQDFTEKYKNASPEEKKKMNKKLGK